MKDWNSNQYSKFEKERTQPSVDLINRIPISPSSILDIGCGPGNSTYQLHKHYPQATILGIDRSDNMLDKARKTHPRLDFRKCIIPEEIDSLGHYDLIFSNACLHWIPEHERLFPKLMNQLRDNGVLAVQMPLVQNAVFYECLHQLIQTDKWKELKDVQVFHNPSPDETYRILSQISSDVTMWETTYYHIVPSHRDVIEWYEGSGLRPYLEKLDAREEAEFLEELLETIQPSFPLQADHSVILKMPRLFFLATKT